MSEFIKTEVELIGGALAMVAPTVITIVLGCLILFAIVAVLQVFLPDKKTEK